MSFPPTCTAALLPAWVRTPAYFEYQQRGLMTLQQFYRGIQQSAFFTPVDFRFYIELVQESRTVRGFLVAPDAFRNEGVVSDEELAAYYERNASGFWTSESVDLEYIELNAGSLPRA